MRNVKGKMGVTKTDTLELLYIVDELIERRAQSAAETAQD
jgi:hypothetical protein